MRTTRNDDMLIHAAIRIAATLSLLALFAFAAQAQETSLIVDEPMSVAFAPRNEAVLASQVTAMVKKIHKEMGEPFEAGDLLVELDAGRYALDRDKYRAQASAASKEYKINSELRKTRSISSLEVDKALKDLNVATAELKKAERDIAACAIRAPYPGRVKKTLTREHQTVKIDEPLIAIISDRALLGKTLLPSRMFATVNVGDEVKIQVNEIGETVVGKISHKSADIDPASSTFEAYAEVENADGTLRSGMTGKILLPKGSN